MTQGTYRDVSDDACDVACDHLVIQHYRSHHPYVLHVMSSLFTNDRGNFGSFLEPSEVEIKD